MPQSAFVAWIKALGAAAASSVGFTGTLSGGAALAVGSAVLASAAYSVNRARQLRDAGDIQRAHGRSVSVRSTILPRNIVYGQANVGGVHTFPNTTSAFIGELRSLFFEVIHTGHEIDSFIGWYLDDKYIPVADVDALTVTNLTDGTYQWTASGSGTDEYYLEASGGGDPGISEPGFVNEEGVLMTAGAVGSLTARSWDWGDNDSLGFSTVYVRLFGGSDPDSQATGFVNAEYGDGGVDADTNSHGKGPIETTDHVLFLRGHPGEAGQALDSMMETGFVELTSSHRHRGCARTVFRLDMLEGAEEVWNGQVPRSLSAVLRGYRVYDPRLDSTFSDDWGTGSGAHRLNDPSTWAWSDSPPLCWAHFRVTVCGWASSRINYNAVAVAADICDADVLIPPASPTTQEARFRCNLVMDLNQPKGDIAKAILDTMNGVEREFGGQYHVFADAWVAADLALTADDLTGSLDYREQPETDDRYNRVRGTYFDEDRLHKRSEFLAVEDPTLRTNRDDSEVLEKDLDLLGVNSEYTAQRVAYRLLNDADNAGLCSFPANYRALDARVGDRVTVTADEIGWTTAKTFRVVGLSYVDFEGVRLGLREDSQAAHDDPLVAEYGTRTAAGTIVFPTRLTDGTEGGGSMLSDPFFARSTLLWDGTGEADGEHLQYFWQDDSEDTASVQILRTGGGVGGVMELTCPANGDRARFRSVSPRPLSRAIGGEYLQAQYLIRKRNNPTLTTGAMVISVNTGDGIGGGTYLWGAGALSIDFTAINAWTVDVWQRFVETGQVGPTAGESLFLNFDCYAWLMSAALTIEVDHVLISRIPAP